MRKSAFMCQCCGCDVCVCVRVVLWYQSDIIMIPVTGIVIHP